MIHRAMGNPAHKAKSLEESRNVDIQYMLAAAEAFTNALAPPLKARGKTFRFVLLSAMLTCRDPHKSLWFMETTRKMKVWSINLFSIFSLTYVIQGEAENGLLALHEKGGSNLDLSIMRPGGVVAKNTLMPKFLVACTSSIKLDELAAVMIDEAIAGAKGTRTMECDVLRNRGRELLMGSQ
jgi:hypothetical protein